MSLNRYKYTLSLILAIALTLATSTQLVYESKPVFRGSISVSMVYRDRYPVKPLNITMDDLQKWMIFYRNVNRVVRKAVEYVKTYYNWNVSTHGLTEVIPYGIPNYYLSPIAMVYVVDTEGNTLYVMVHIGSGEILGVVKLACSISTCKIDRECPLVDRYLVEFKNNVSYAKQFVKQVLMKYGSESLKEIIRREYVDIEIVDIEQGVYRPRGYLVVKYTLTVKNYTIYCPPCSEIPTYRYRITGLSYRELGFIAYYPCLNITLFTTPAYIIEYFIKNNLVIYSDNVGREEAVKSALNTFNTMISLQIIYPHVAFRCNSSAYIVTEVLTPYDYNRDGLPDALTKAYLVEIPCGTYNQTYIVNAYTGEVIDPFREPRIFTYIIYCYGEIRMAIAVCIASPSTNYRYW